MPRPEASFATPEVTVAARALGSAIKQARLARNRTRSDFAERAHISTATLDRLEQGDVAVRMGAWFAALQAANLLQLLEKISDIDADILGRVERDKRQISAMRKSAYHVKPGSTKNDDYDF
jgi:transcriptional regulator with XRE-family HTH domain